MELLVCDWLLTTRTEVWQRDCAALASANNVSEEEAVTTRRTMFADELMAFQQDLTSLRRLAHHCRPAMTKVSSALVDCIMRTLYKYTGGQLYIRAVEGTCV